MLRVPQVPPVGWQPSSPTDLLPLLIPTALVSLQITEIFHLPLLIPTATHSSSSIPLILGAMESMDAFPVLEALSLACCLALPSQPQVSLTVSLCFYRK